jgi:ABC-type branched-subunit amino acid transport system substrate-binding protein
MLEQIDTLKADAIILYVNPIAFPVLYKGLRGLGVTLPILAGAACAHPAIFAQGPEAVEGVYVMDSGGNVNAAAMPDSWPSKALQLEFAQRYQAKYNTPPDFFASTGGDVVTILVAAMKQAGELDQANWPKLVNLKDHPPFKAL